MKTISNTRSFEIISENVILMKFHKNIELTLENLKTDYQIYDKLTQGKPFYKISVLNKNTITNEARLFVEKENKLRSNLILGEAIVTMGMKQRFFLNAYLIFQAKSFPVKTFLNVNGALNWVNELNYVNEKSLFRELSL
jgi:hypothetical protein